MNESDRIIKKLAETYGGNPKGCISILERWLERTPSNEKGYHLATIGITLYRLSYFMLALAVWNRALEYYVENGDRLGESSCYTNLGIACDRLGDFSKAIDYHEKALEIDREIDDRSGESKCYRNLGNALCGLGDFRKGIEFHEKSLEIASEIDDRSGESSCYGNLGNAHCGLGDFRKGIEYHEKSLEIDREIDDRPGESECYRNLGNAHCGLGDFRKAIEYHEKSLEIASEIDDRSGESKCYRNLGTAHCGLGDFRKGIEYHEKCLEIASEIDDRSGESLCYGNLGNAHYGLGNFRKAIEYYERALEIAREIGDRSRESSCYSNLGAAYRSSGDFRKAIEYCERALEIAREIGDRSGESSCSLTLGAAYSSLGDFGRAIEYEKEALEIAGEIGDRSRESKCYTGLGNAYGDLGDFRKAIEYHEKALEINREFGDRSGESSCYSNLGAAYGSLGDFRKAIEYDEKALEINREFGDRSGESNCYGNLGIVYCSLGDFRKAIEYENKALEIAREIGDRSGESNCYGNLGAAYRRSGNFKKAIRYHEKSLEIAREIGDLDSERRSARNLAWVYGDHLNKPELAYDYCRNSIELSERISGRLIEEEDKIGFSSRTSDAYEYMIPLCLELKKGNEAFEFAERGKSRAFLDLLAATEIKPSVELTPELRSLLDEEETYLVKLRETQTQHLGQKDVSVEPGEVDRILEELALIYSKAEELDPEYAFTRRGKPLSLSKIQDMLYLHKRDTVLVEYFVATEKLFIFVVSSRDKELYVETVPISQEKLRRYVENYWRSVAKYSDFMDIGDSWLCIGSYLIDPISKYLVKGDLIYFIPYGLLHYLPLHALQLNGEPLIKNHSVTYSPSASLIKFCQNKGSGELRSCASFGVVFENEAKRVAELFDVKPFIGNAATKEQVIRTCADKDIIHFSCHGRFDTLDPLSSGVELYDEEVLTAREIFRQKLNTELVTLSACETGISERRPGDELIGLTRAFLYAGAPSVIVSLWSVNASSTQELMVEFYKSLRKGTDKATALQQAQKKTMEKEEYSNPYYWAPFILVGDWK